MKKIRAVVAVLLALLMFCSTALAVQFPDVDVYKRQPLWRRRSLLSQDFLTL